MASIVHKMKSDSVDQAVIDKWAGVAAPVSAEDEAKSDADAVRLAALPTRKMKPFHWAKLTRLQVYCNDTTSHWHSTTI